MSFALLVTSTCAWIAAGELTRNKNYFEFQNGWYIQLRPGHGYFGAENRNERYIAIGQFPDHGNVIKSLPYTYKGPNRWPDFSERSLDISWLILVSFVIPLVWLVIKYRKRHSARGFPLDEIESTWCFRK